METLSLDYDLLWNRLDVFLVSSETADARTRHGLGSVLARLFDEVKALEPQMQAGKLQEGDALVRELLSNLVYGVRRHSCLTPPGPVLRP